MKVTQMPTPAIENPVVLQQTLPASCLAQDQPDGGIQVHFLIDSTVARKLRTRAGRMPMAKYLWENILHRSIQDHVY